MPTDWGGARTRAQQGRHRTQAHQPTGGARRAEGPSMAQAGGHPVAPAGERAGRPTIATNKGRTLERKATRAGPGPSRTRAGTRPRDLLVAGWPDPFMALRRTWFRRVDVHRELPARRSSRAGASLAGGAQLRGVEATRNL